MRDAQPVVLIAAIQAQPLVTMLEREGYTVVHARTASATLHQAGSIQPDAVILEDRLPDMDGIDLCRSLCDDPRISRKVPIFILTPEEPTSEHWLGALRAGAWYCVRRPSDPEQLLHKLRTYVQTRWGAEAAGEGLIDPTTGLHNVQGLARRARELGTLMSRQHGALACVVFAVEVDNADPEAGKVVMRTVEALKSSSRVSDVIAALGPVEFAVLAPATDREAAVKLAERMARALKAAGEAELPSSSVRVGYDAVANLGYTPMDPMELLARATVALRRGRPEPNTPWVRRFDAGVGGVGSG